MNMKYPVLVLALLLCSGRASTECPSKCACADETINCSAQALTQVPTEGTLPHTVLWNLSHNNISALHHDTLQIARHFKNHFEIDLSDNHINNVSENAFSHLENLSALDLSSNNISKIEFKNVKSKHLFSLYLSHNQHLHLPDHGFSLPHLKVLEMAKCGLTHIPAGFFANTKDIETLVLSKNRISTLGSHVVSHLRYLVYLDLSDNKFTALPSGLLHHLDISARVRLGGNPFLCACKARSSYDQYLEHRRPVPLHCRHVEGDQHLSYPHFFEQSCVAPATAETHPQELSASRPEQDPPSSHFGVAAVAGGIAGVLVVAVILLLVVVVRLRSRTRERATCPQRFSILKDNEDV